MTPLFSRKEMSVSSLALKLNNYRFPNSALNEQDAIVQMIKLRKVGPEKIINLINDIINNNIFEDFIVFKEDNLNVVYDGNRRLTAIKLFEEKNLIHIKEIYPKLYKYITKIKAENDLSKLKVAVKIYNDKDSMLNHIERLHSGELQGVGRIRWEKAEKENFLKETSPTKKQTFSNQFMSLLENKEEHRKLLNKIIDYSNLSTYDRIFGSSQLKQRIFKLKPRQLINMNNVDNFNKICEIIEYFIDNKGTVGDVYSKDDIVLYFQQIEPITTDSSHEKKSPDKVPPIDEEKKDDDKINPINNDKEVKDVEKPVNDDKMNTYRLILKLKKYKITINQYEDYDLSQLIDEATDNKGINLKQNVKFFLENKLIKNNELSGDTVPGKHSIQVKLENNNESKSALLSVQIKTAQKNPYVFPIDSEQLFTPVSSFVKNNPTIQISETVDQIINEIRSLNEPERYPLLIASSTRQLIERTFDILIQTKSLNYTKADSTNFIKFYNEFKTNHKLISRIAAGPNILSFQETKNFIVSVDPEWLFSFLNLITHNSSHTFYSELENTINKKITPLLIIFHNYLKIPSE